MAEKRQPSRDGQSSPSTRECAPMPPFGMRARGDGQDCPSSTEPANLPEGYPCPARHSAFRTQHSEDVDRIDVDGHLDALPAPADHHRLDGAAEGDAVRRADEDLVAEDAFDPGDGCGGRALDARSGDRLECLFEAPAAVEGGALDVGERLPAK